MNKEDRISKGEHRSKNGTYTTFKKTETFEGFGQGVHTQTNKGWCLLFLSKKVIFNKKGDKFDLIKTKIYLNNS